MINSDKSESSIEIISAHLESNVLNISGSGGVYIAKLSTNSKWTIQYDSNWFTVLPITGEPGEDIVITINAELSDNYGSAFRKGEINITSGDANIEFVVSQSYSSNIFSGHYVQHINCEEQTVLIPLFNTKDIQIIIPDNTDWVSLKDIDISNNNITLLINENSKEDSRYSQLSILDESTTTIEYFHIYQNQREVVIPDSYDMNVNGIYYKIYSIDDLTVEVVGGENVYYGNINIPDVIEYNGETLKVVSIGSRTFYNSSIKQITIGNNIKYIGGSAFYGCKMIQSISIPPSVSTIYERAFDECTSLSELQLMDGNTVLNFYSSSNNVPDYFVNCPLEIIYIGRTIDHWSFTPAFADLSYLTEVTIGDMVSKIPAKLLSGAKLINELKIPSKVTYLGNGAFDYCYKLSKVIFEDGDSDLVFTIGRGSTETGGGTGGTVNSAMFCDSPLDTLYLGRNLVVSSAYQSAGAMFDYTPIKNLIIGTSVSSLCDFSNCRELERLDIPASVESIYHFNGCTKLKDIICRGLTPPYPKYSWCGFPNITYINGTLKVPFESINIYNTTSPWNNFFNIEKID